RALAPSRCAMHHSRPTAHPTHRPDRRSRLLAPGAVVTRSPFVPCLALVWGSLSATIVGAQQAPPSTDIYVSTLDVRDGRVTIGAPANVTRSPGYDNQ